MWTTRSLARLVCNSIGFFTDFSEPLTIFSISVANYTLSLIYTCDTNSIHTMTVKVNNNIESQISIGTSWITVCKYKWGYHSNDYDEVLVKLMNAVNDAYTKYDFATKFAQDKTVRKKYLKALALRQRTTDRSAFIGTLLYIFDDIALMAVTELEGIELLAERLWQMSLYTNYPTEAPMLIGVNVNSKNEIDGLVFRNPFAPGAQSSKSISDIVTYPLKFASNIILNPSGRVNEKFNAIDNYVNFDVSKYTVLRETEFLNGVYFLKSYTSESIFNYAFYSFIPIATSFKHKEVRALGFNYLPRYRDGRCIDRCVTLISASDDKYVIEVGNGICKSVNLDGLKLLQEKKIRFTNFAITSRGVVRTTNFVSLSCKDLQQPNLAAFVIKESCTIKPTDYFCCCVIPDSVYEDINLVIDDKDLPGCHFSCFVQNQHGISVTVKFKNMKHKWGGISLNHAWRSNALTLVPEFPASEYIFIRGNTKLTSVALTPLEFKKHASTIRGFADIGFSPAVNTSVVGE